mgnify:CR=1 FL=1
MEITAAQSELRNAYAHGGPGTLISGILWMAAATTQLYAGTSTGFAVLFFGGMFLFPATKLVLSICFRRPSESRENHGGLVVIETVFPMIGGLFAAWLLLPQRPEFVFSVAAIAVGAHYFGFSTAYGDWTFWVLGAIMCSVGVAAILFAFPPHNTVGFAIAGVEVAFGCWFLWTDFKATQIDSAHPTPEETFE